MPHPHLLRWGLLCGLISLSAGCHRGGLRIPGPLDAMRYEADAPPQRSAAAEPAPPRRAGVPVVPRALLEGGEGVALSAMALIGAEVLDIDGEIYRYDCSGLVEAAYAGIGQALRGSSRDMFVLAGESGVLHDRLRPLPGDVVFFDDTYDRNKNRRRDDELTHVGIVETVDAEGTMTVVHLGNGGVGRLRMNLEHPDDPKLNSPLRSTGDRDGGPVLAGELWRGFGSLWMLSSGGPVPQG